MRYESENFLEPKTRIEDVREFIELLGYVKSGILKSGEYGQFEEYWFFDEKDFRSWSGVSLSIHKDSKQIIVSTLTPIVRSYYDLVHQNHTISSLRKRFGGHFTTDEGRGRYLRPTSGPPSAPASGCHLAYERFGSNLIKAVVYLDARAFPKHPPRGRGDPLVVLGMDPRTLSNNLLIPFLVAALEEYFKSSFIALLRYSSRKDVFLKGIRLQGDQLLPLAEGKATLEEQIVQTLPFQRISAVCRHFESLDPKLDLSGILRRPYRRRRQSLFELLETTVVARHNFIHRAQLDTSLTDKRLYDLVDAIEAAITRVYRRITDHYRWQFDRGWSLGRRTVRAAAQLGAPGDAPQAACP